LQTGTHCRGANRGNALQHCVRTLIAIGPLGLLSKHQPSGRLMPSQRDIDRRNDARLLTPLLVMALVIAGGVLVWVLTGHALTG